MLESPPSFAYDGNRPGLTALLPEAVIEDLSRVLRIIDANANRTREALRVAEDFARFVLDSTAWSERLKELRHRLAAAIASLGAADGLALHRDTEGDVGTALSTEAERSRAEPPDVLWANLKRAQEGLRVLEEYGKLVRPDAAERLKAIRYEVYTVEKGLARLLHPHERLKDARLYVLVTTSLLRGRDPAEVARDAIRGGADIIQLREKTMSDGEFAALARRLRDVCRAEAADSPGALFVVNDRIDVAKLVDADGVHVGQEDLPAADARRLLGPEKIVGVSTHSPEQARAAALAGASYIGVGPVNATPTKPTTAPVGLEYVRHAAAHAEVPFFAIGGVNLQTVDSVLDAGARRIAVCSAVVSADDVRSAAAALKAALMRFGM